MGHPVLAAKSTFPVRLPDSCVASDEFLGNGHTYQYEETKHRRNGAYEFMHARIDDVVFVDSSYRCMLPSGYCNAKDLLYLVDFGWAMRNHRLIRYTALADAALETLDLKNEVVLDFGAGDGVLSMRALKRGAQEVHSFDTDWAKLDLMLRHCDENCLDRARVTLHALDVRNYDAVQGALPRQPTIIVANLGPHYDGADLAVINLLYSLPSVRAFVGGGYTRYGCYDATTALNALYAAGFKQSKRVIYERAQYGGRIDRHGKELPPRMAFVVER